MPSNQPKLDQQTKARIDAMTRLEMAEHWRFAPVGDPLVRDGPVGDYFEARFKSLGGFSPGISKAIGWGT